MNQIKVLIFDVQNVMKKKKDGVKKIRGEIPNFHGLNIKKGQFIIHQVSHIPIGVGVYIPFGEDIF